MYLAVISCILLRSCSILTDDRQCTQGSTNRHCQPAMEFGLGFFQIPKKRRPRPTKPYTHKPNHFIRQTPFPIQNVMYVTSTVSNLATTTQKVRLLPLPPPIPLPENFELQVKQKSDASSLFSQTFGTSNKLRQNITTVDISNSLTEAKETRTPVPHLLTSSQKKYSSPRGMKAVKTKSKSLNYKLNNSKSRTIKPNLKKLVHRSRNANKNRKKQRNLRRKKKTRIQSNNVTRTGARRTSNTSKSRGYMWNMKRKAHATSSKSKNRGIQVKSNSKNRGKTNSTFSAITAKPATIDIPRSHNLLKQVKGTNSTKIKSISTTERPQLLSSFEIIRIPNRELAGRTRKAKMKKYEKTKKNNGRKSVPDYTQKNLKVALNFSEDSTKQTSRKISLHTMFTAAENTVTSIIPQTHTPEATLSTQPTSPNTTPNVSKPHHARQNRLITQEKATETFKTPITSLDDRYRQKFVKTTSKPKSYAKPMDANAQSSFTLGSTTIAPDILPKLNEKQLQSVTGKITTVSKQRKIEADITTDISPTVLVLQQRRTQTTIRQGIVPAFRQSTKTQQFSLQARNTKSREYKGAENAEITQPIHNWIPDTKNPRTLHKHEVNRSWSVKVNPPQEDWTSSDNRASAVGIGSIGIIVILAIITGVVCLDAATLYRDAKRIRKKIYRIFRPLNKRQCKDTSVSKNLPKWAHFVTTREA